MHNVTLAATTAFTLCLLGAALTAQVDPRFTKELTTDAPGSKDLLVPRYTGSFALAQVTKDFDELTLPMGKATGASYSSEPTKKLRYEKSQTVEGRLIRTIFVIPEGRSTLEVVRNYSAALEAKGAKALFQCAKIECGDEFNKLHTGGGRVIAQEGAAVSRERRSLTANAFEYVEAAADQRLWVGQWTRPGQGDLYVSVYAATQTGGSMGDISAALKGRVLAMVEVVEMKSMETNLSFVSSADMGSALTKTGRVALYGITFEFDKAEIRPESDKQLQEMATLLKANAGLSVFIVGHTDNKGTLAYNIDLSQRRAEAVAKALSTRFGIAATRMTARGVGPLSPVSVNDDEAGQAKNRRVELVKQ